MFQKTPEKRCKNDVPKTTVLVFTKTETPLFGGCGLERYKDNTIQ